MDGDEKKKNDHPVQEANGRNGRNVIYTDYLHGIISVKNTQQVCEINRQQYYTAAKIIIIFF